ncbi:hypothetical protein [Mycobacterium asiaticum]|uniref:Uncharacterized protein n=1 Tax=Mycobacterium asiaticum TaxID=1790 RepID=A0A1A3NQ29_MYCAS|nr:hypothetical protein [Mycobacterium asiaticum]OBK22397.1 hypothetical protein A5635_21860 [Mycobacterium asiaticum]
MKSTLADHVTTNSRFTRSANVERDRGGAAIEGYVPTGRALDVLSRIANGLADPAAGRAFSITGPHGGGKSSFAVFLDGLVARPNSSEFKAAHAILTAIDDALDAKFRDGMRAVKAGRAGFTRASATARNEPVAATIARALHAGAIRQFGPTQEFAPAGFASMKYTPSTDDIRTCVQRLTELQPLLLIIDEFGKNLEHFALTGTEGDPFLLQELAEMTQGAGAAPLIIVTMQHLSFDEYVQDSSTARRKEWSKVQGRFQDIPYVETHAQSRRLIASAIQQDELLREAAGRWVSQHRDALDAQGLRDIAEDAAAAIPLHPMALAVLPDLCSRYGQNERTLFSFLTSSEPSALPAYLAVTEWAPGSPPPLVGIDALYDYFLESSASMIGVADGASRWLEIETRIRDTAGLSPAQLRALKTIGLLNLVSTGGRIRASQSLVEFALQVGGDHCADVDEVLTSLVDAGLITYRAFSDEYRIWHGSDYDVRRVIDNARHQYEEAELADLLSQALHLEPLVASRHSQRTGVLRVFGRQFIGGETQTAQIDPSWDGIIYYTTDLSTNARSVAAPADGRPAVYVVPAELAAVRSAAVDAAALSSALRIAEAEGADWVAQRELVERASGAQQRLHIAIGEAWNSRASWILAGYERELNPRTGISALLSQVADIAYPDTPRVPNEMIARRELTSQGAKARRFLTDALIAHPDEEAFGIEGYGPDRAIYEAVFRSTGMHRMSDPGRWALHPPSDRTWKPAWASMNSAFDSAVDSRVSLAEIGLQLTLPPVGLKQGIVPLLLVVGLLHRGDEVALYEHGSLVLSIDDAVAERLTKNLSHFSIKNTETRSSKRAVVIASLVDRLGIKMRSGGGTPTFLNVATALYRELRILPPFVQKTKRHLSRDAADVRDAFHHAAEPDVLLFETLPEIFGFGSFSGGRGGPKAAAEFADRLAGTIGELRECYPVLLTSVHRQLAEATSTSGDLGDVRRALEADATRLQGHVLEPRLKALVGALLRPLDDQAWLENVAMVVSDGQAPRVWTDDVAGRFALRIAELGGALRRTSALLHERLASTSRQSYVTRRMTLTRPDGTESIELLSLTETERTMVDQYFLPLIDEVAAGGISRATACRMLMARLAEEYESTGSAQTHAVYKEVQQHG